LGFTMLDYNIFVFCCVHQINSLHIQLNMMSPIHYINLLCSNQHVIAFLLLKCNNLLSLSSNEGLLECPFLTYLLTSLLLSFGVYCIVFLNIWKVYETSSLLTSVYRWVFEDVASWSSFSFILDNIIVDISRNWEHHALFHLVMFDKFIKFLESLCSFSTICCNLLIIVDVFTLLVLLQWLHIHSLWQIKWLFMFFFMLFLPFFFLTLCLI
jgi:hypothetical protein